MLYCAGDLITVHGGLPFTGSAATVSSVPVCYSHRYLLQQRFGFPVVVQRFSSVLLHDFFVDDHRPEYGV